MRELITDRGDGNVLWLEELGRECQRIYQDEKSWWACGGDVWSCPKRIGAVKWWGKFIGACEVLGEVVEGAESVLEVGGLL